MLKTSKYALLGLIGMSVATFAAAPADAHGEKKYHHHGHKVVKIVKKTVYVPVDHRYSRQQRRWHRKWERKNRRWDRREQRWHRRQVIHHHYDRHSTVVHPSYGYGNKAIAGTVIGAALGALTGNTIGKGSGRVAAIVTGGVIGAIVGGHVGDSMDKADRIQAHHALETARTGQRVAWTNPDNGREYTVTPTRTYVQENGRYCRDFTTWGWIDGYEEKLHGTACRTANGTWRRVG
jgi:surface antigen